jgi:hypothetical protein
MMTQAVLNPRALHLTLFKKDSPRHIDRVIDYFGGGPSATTRQGAEDESAGDDASSQGHVDRPARAPPALHIVLNPPDGLKDGDRVVLAAAPR